MLITEKTVLTIKGVFRNKKSSIHVKYFFRLIILEDNCMKRLKWNPK